MKTKLASVLIFLISIKVFTQVGFNKNIITGNNDGLTITGFSVFAADIDGDGDMDLLSTSRDDDKIAWYENLDGLGNFASQQVISISGNEPIHMNVVDLDGDGDLDVLSISDRNSGNTIDPKLVWYENLDGLGDFGAEQVITNSVYSPTYVSFSDVDGDGDMDVLSASTATSIGDNKIAWYENLDGLGSFGSQQVIDFSSSSSYFFRQVLADDIDGDGDMDVVSFTDAYVWWYENVDGLGTFGAPVNIDEFNSASSDSGYLTDIDNDGDVDILVVDEDITLYKNNDGELGTFTKHELPNINGFHVVLAADLDNDGDKDIVGAGDYSIRWSENIGGIEGFSDYQIIAFETGVQYGYKSIFAADLNSDGKMDLQSASFWNDEIAWYENQGLIVNEINGIVQLDLDSNGCDINDLSMSNVMVSAVNNDISFTTFTFDNGSYELLVDEGGFEVSITSSLPNYYSSNPISQNLNFDSLGNFDTLDFCVEPNVNVNSLSISTYPSINSPRPGFNTTYQLVYHNIGTTQLSGSVSFEFNNTKLQFLNASETTSSQTSNILTFDFTDLSPFETRTIDLEFNVFAPPTTEIDDELVAIATINPVLGDETEDDNVFELQQTVVGSYDPNDITCLEGDQILIEDADKYLHYLIRFQNTGTASAINVRVENVLDDKLDWTTMQLENLSHTGRVDILNGNEVSFVFDNINLPDSTNDESNSHGFIAYKIKPKDNVILGDIFYNTADIYFDFNPPIITNTVSTEIVEDQLSISDFENNVFKVFPNPTNSKLTIQSKVGLREIRIVDINGRLLSGLGNLDLTHVINLDVKNLSNGIYFLKIQAENNEQTVRFIKN